MTESKQKPIVRIGKKEKTAILNYGLIKEQIKTLTKQKDLLKDEILPYFEKTNAIMLTGLDLIIIQARFIIYEQGCMDYYTSMELMHEFTYMYIYIYIYICFFT